MRKIVLLFTALLLIVSGCSKKDEAQNLKKPSKDAPANVQVRGGKVLEIIQTSTYTYLRVEETTGEVWIAAAKMDIKEGENIYFSQAMEMANFKGEEAKKTFEKILFVSDASKDKAAFGNNTGKPGALPSDFKHPEKEGPKKEEIKVEKATGGVTIGEVFSKKADLKNTTVKIRGKVTKVNSGIMNTNWIHIQDGTGSAKEYDLIVTSDDVPAVGDVILVEGLVSVDKDFGAGYKYDVIVEKAKILEKK
jgi:hypothetical protein